MIKHKCENLFNTAFVLLILITAIPTMLPYAYAGEGGSSHYGPGFYGDYNKTFKLADVELVK